MRMLNMPALIEKTRLGRASIYRYIRLKRFPAPVKIGERAVGWVEEEVDEWLKDRVKARDQQ